MYIWQCANVYLTNRIRFTQRGRLWRLKVLNHHLVDFISRILFTPQPPHFRCFASCWFSRWPFHATSGLQKTMAVARFVLCSRFPAQLTSSCSGHANSMKQVTIRSYQVGIQSYQVATQKCQVWLVGQTWQLWITTCSIWEPLDELWPLVKFTIYQCKFWAA